MCLRILFIYVFFCSYHEHIWQQFVRKLECKRVGAQKPTDMETGDTARTGDTDRTGDTTRIKKELVSYMYGCLFVGTNKTQ